MPFQELAERRGKAEKPGKVSGMARCVWVLGLAWLSSVAAAGMNVSEARQELDTPRLFFFTQTTEGAECAGQGLQLCRGMLVNSINFIDSVTLTVTVTGAGRLVNFPLEAAANDRRGQCDTYVRAGTLGFPGTSVIRASSDWTDGGTEAIQYRFTVNGQRVPLLSCGLPVLSAATSPECPQGDFYQLVAQLALEPPVSVEIAWLLGTTSQTSFSGVSTCNMPITEPNFFPTTFVETTMSTTGATTTEPTTASTTTQATSTSTEATTTATTVCPPNADLVPDGRVDLLDIAKLVDEMDAGNLSMADLNCDGVLNVADTSVALGQWTG